MLDWRSSTTLHSCGSLGYCHVGLQELHHTRQLWTTVMPECRSSSCGPLDYYDAGLRELHPRHSCGSVVYCDAGLQELHPRHRCRPLGYCPAGAPPTHSYAGQRRTSPRKQTQHARLAAKCVAWRLGARFIQLSCPLAI